MAVGGVPWEQRRASEAAVSREMCLRDTGRCSRNKTWGMNRDINTGF